MLYSNKCLGATKLLHKAKGMFSCIFINSTYTELEFFFK